MFQRHKWPTFEGIVMILVMVISIFSFAFFTEDKITGAGFTDVTGNMVKVTGG